MEFASHRATTDRPNRAAGFDAIVRDAPALRVGLILMTLCLSWTALVRADDVLDKNVHFDIRSAPLGNALVQFATQSGVQVAVADSDVVRLQSEGLHGDYSVQQALSMLLHNTGLTYTPVGETVAIRATSSTSAATSTMQAQLPDVTVIAPPAPTPGQLAGGDLFDFVVHHGTTDYSVSVGASTGGLMRWRGGRSQSPCPMTVGLDAAYNDFVTARVRAVGAYVGAPLVPDLHCKPNLEVLFTTDPQKSMAAVLKWAGRSLGVKYPHQMQDLLQHSASHPVQGWYITVGGGASTLNADSALLGRLELRPLWPLVIPTSNHVNDAGRGILDMILVVDTTKVAGATIGSIADYAAMVGLSLIQSPDHCDSLPSILDLMAPSCQSRDKPAGITAGDLAFLKALYYHNTGLGRTLSRNEIQRNMLDQFKSGVSSRAN
jgi:hypothetical protein